jgi:adenine C2-methylase RlmN of 23S rRNA A2503 and tRNA A37
MKKRKPKLKTSKIGGALTPPFFMQTRREQFQNLFPSAPGYRWSQIENALFSDVHGWDDVSTISKPMRDTLKTIPWMSLKQVEIKSENDGESHKAILRAQDEKMIESVLIKNRRGAWTACLSTQVGCAMRCAFCATGKMGLARNLTSDEIVDQFRFWRAFVSQATTPRISNIVLMGMGEPLANYENVRDALNIILARTDIGETHITVSTVGVLARLEQILTDKNWPGVRLAISLHSAIAKTRKQIVPTSFDDFLSKLSNWARRYLKQCGNRRHHLTFEYIMLRGVNDDEAHAKALAVYANKIGKVKINLIPYNATDSNFSSPDEAVLSDFLDTLTKNGTLATVRRSAGQNISAACGQLIIDKNQ